MSMWEQITKHPGFEKIQTLYNENFPVEVRSFCAQWIEDRIKADQFIDINDPQYEQRAVIFMNNLIQQLEQEKLKFQKNGEVTTLCRLDEAIRRFRPNMEHAVQYYKHIRDALMYEQHFLDNFTNKTQTNYMDTEAIEIDEKLKHLRQLNFGNGQNYKRYKQELEQYMITYSDCTKRIQELNNMQLTPEQRAQMLEDYRRKILLMTESISVRPRELYTDIHSMIEKLNEVQTVVIHKRLGKWQRDQALAGNGAPLPMSALDEIQSWFEILADLTWDTRSLIDTMRKTNLPIQGQANVGDGFEAAYREVTTLLQNLIVSGFIVEKQPPQVMKTNTR